MASAIRAGNLRARRAWTPLRRDVTSLPMIGFVLAAISLAVWVYLVFARGWFWLGRERDDAAIVPPAAWPGVAIVVPARNEADGIAQSVTSLLRQDYPAFSLVVVDDDSDDGTAGVA